MTKKQRAVECVNRLKEYYPDANCSLVSYNALELLIATRLSAQCTDARVNMVTPLLFNTYKSAEEFANASVTDVEAIIKSCGLFKTKAKSIVEMCKMICETFNGEVPHTLDDLIMLPGIGRKTANLIMGDVYGKPAVVTDTHLIRITNRIGLCGSTDPYKVEMQLKSLLPPAESSDFCHRIVKFGREICSARAKKCGECPLFDICKSSDIKNK